MLLLFAWLALLCVCLDVQLLASGLVYALSMALYFRRSIVTSPARRYAYAFVISIMIASSMWSTPFTMLSDKVRPGGRTGWGGGGGRRGAGSGAFL
jgi:hypothetical protein